MKVIILYLFVLNIARKKDNLFDIDIGEKILYY